MAAEAREERLGHDLTDDEQSGPDPERRPERLRREPCGLVLPARARGARHDRRRPVREEVEDRERAGEDGAGEAERRDLRPAEVTDDRRVGEDVQRLGRQRAERRQRETDDLAIVRGPKAHRPPTIMARMGFEPNQLFRVPSSRILRVFLGLVVLAALAGLFWWRRDTLTTIGSAFRAVRWEWVAVAIALNLLSVIARAFAWTLVIHSAMEPPRPRVPLVFSAFSVGLFANAVLPGRIGELARVAVLTRKMPGRKGAWPTLVGTVFAHRVFDIVPVLLLILYVVVTASIPGSARATLVFVIGFGVGLFVFAFLSARRQHQQMAIEGLGPVRRLLTMGRAGLGVMRAPAEAAGAILFQIIGWTCQILAVYTAMRAFDIHAPLPAAGVVLLLMNVVTIFPFWPGNVGLVQVAIASALVGYGVSYSTGVAYGFGLQAIEASVGIGVGLLFLAREGLSFAMLSVMPTADKAEVPAEETAADQDRPAERAAAR